MTSGETDASKAAALIPGRFHNIATDAHPSMNDVRERWQKN